MRRITSVTKRDIFEYLNMPDTPWWNGRLQDHDFLARLYDLSSIASTDSRFSNAEQDIIQHTVANDDWPPDWVFLDERFGLKDGPDDVFLRFLCETLHPEVIRWQGDVTDMVAEYNDLLRYDYYEIYSASEISGRPVFGFRELIVPEMVSFEALKESEPVATHEYLRQQVNRMKNAVDDDPTLAIGTAKELIETCCRTILEERGETIQKKNPEVSELVKATTKCLALTPDDIPEEAKAAEQIRILLSSLGSITHQMAELRNAYGTGHGKGSKTKGLRPRHARLVVGAASTIVNFLFDTHKERPIE